MRRTRPLQPARERADFSTGDWTPSALAGSACYRLNSSASDCEILADRRRDSCLRQRRRLHSCWTRHARLAAPMVRSRVTSSPTTSRQVMHHASMNVPRRREPVGALEDVGPISVSRLRHSCPHPRSTARYPRCPAASGLVRRLEVPRGLRSRSGAPPNRWTDADRRRPRLGRQVRRRLTVFAVHRSKQSMGSPEPKWFRTRRGRDVRRPHAG